jgi:GDP-L-fucose synthase
MNKDARIFVAGHRGLAGSAILRQLKAEGYNQLVLRDRQQLDLEVSVQVDQFFAEQQPEYVFLAAARVGGILANSQYPADFLRNNLLIQLNVFEACRRYGVKKLLFLGSSCIYPRLAPQPIREDYLLSGALEPTNQSYAIAKIAGIQMAQAYRQQYGLNAISLMPTNLYGPGDNFDPQSSHVAPALIHKLHLARAQGLAEVSLWGTGTPRREFLHVDDLARAALLLMQNYDQPEIVNVGWGKDIPIAELANLIAEVVGYEGRIVFDPSMPDGTPRRYLDTTRLQALGWQPQISLRQGLAETYQWYLQNKAQG